MFNLLSKSRQLIQKSRQLIQKSRQLIQMSRQLIQTGLLALSVVILSLATVACGGGGGGKSGSGSSSHSGGGGGTVVVKNDYSETIRECTVQFAMSSGNVIPLNLPESNNGIAVGGSSSTIIPDYVMVGMQTSFSNVLAGKVRCTSDSGDTVLASYSSQAHAFTGFHTGNSGKSGGGNDDDGGGGSVSTTGGLPGAFITVQNNAGVDFTRCNVNLHYSFGVDKNNLVDNLADTGDVKLSHTYLGLIKAGQLSAVISNENDSTFINTLKNVVSHTSKQSIELYCINETTDKNGVMETTAYSSYINNTSKLENSYLFTLNKYDPDDNTGTGSSSHSGNYYIDSYKYTKYDDSVVPLSSITYTINTPANLALYGCSISFSKSLYHSDSDNTHKSLIETNGKISDDKIAMVTGTPHKLTKNLADTINLLGMTTFSKDSTSTQVDLSCYDDPVASSNDKQTILNYTVSGDTTNGLIINISEAKALDEADVYITNHANIDLDKCLLELETNDYKVSLSVPDKFESGTGGAFMFTSNLDLVNKVMSVDHNPNIYAKCAGHGQSYYYSEPQHKIRTHSDFIITEHQQDITHLPASANVPAGSKYAYTITGVTAQAHECKAIVETTGSWGTNKYYIESYLALTPAKGYLSSKVEPILGVLWQEQLPYDNTIKAICKDASGNIVSHSDAVPFDNPVTINLVAGAPTP